LIPDNLTRPWHWCRAIAALVALSSVIGCRPADDVQGTTIEDDTWVVLSANELAALSYSPSLAVHHDPAGRVKVEISTAWKADELLVVRGVFTPDDHGFYLYSRELPMSGINGIGRPTLIEVGDTNLFQRVGPLMSDQKPVEQIDELSNVSFPVYPERAVTMYLPLRFKASPQSSATIQIMLSYMSCSTRRCNSPIKRSVETINLAFPTIAVRAGQNYPVDLGRIDRRIVREPKYEARPHYALVVFGSNAAHRSWLVMDGEELLYFDRNGNGDLTESEDLVTLDTEATSEINIAEGSAYKGMNVFPIGQVADVDTKFQFWVRKKGFTPDDWQRSILAERDANDWETGTLWRIAEDGSMAQNGTILTARPQEAQITHLNGPLTFGLKHQRKQRFQPWPKRTVFDVHIGTRSLAAKSAKHEVFSPLTEQEIPRDVHPIAVVEFPAQISGGRPVVREFDLEERCCGDTVFTRMTIPREVGSGIAKVLLSYPAWTNRTIHSDTFLIPIERDLSEYSEASFVMFPSKSTTDQGGAVDLSAIEKALQKKGFEFSRYSDPSGESIMLRLPAVEMFKPAISITLEGGDEILTTAQALGEGTPYASMLSECDKRFTLQYLGITQILEEESTMITILSTLQKTTAGILYNTWERELEGPM